MASCLLRNVPKEELAFSRERSGDVLPSVDVLLGSVDDADVPAPQRQQLILEHIASVRALVHQVQLRYHADRAETWWPLSGVEVGTGKNSQSFFFGNFPFWKESREKNPVYNPILEINPGFYSVYF